MDFAFWYTLSLLVIMSILLVKEWIETEVVIFSVLLLLIAGKVISIKEAFSGFSNEGMITIALLFVIAGTLYRTGAVGKINPIIFGNINSSITKKLLRIQLPVSTFSAFMNNTPLVAMLIPALRSWTEKNHYAPSKFLIPISYAAMLGGMCTLIGSSTNLIVHGLMIDNGMKGLAFFELSVVGLPIALIGILFVSVFGHRLLPQRKDAIVKLGENTREFVIELKVTAEYENIGKTIEQGGLRHLQGLFLFQIERNGEILAPAKPNENILEGDRLFFTGIPKTILELQKTPGLQLIKDSTFDLKQYNSAQVKTYEAVISSSSPLIGKNVRDSNFREKYEAVIIAIHRNGHRIERKIGDITLHPGDTLLLLAGKGFLKKWYHSVDFYLISNAEDVPSKPQWQAYLALGVFLGMVALAALEVLPLVSAAGLAAAVLVVTRSITPFEGRQAVDWSVLVIIASAFGIAAALENSGLADFLARGIVKLGGRFGVVGVLASVYVATSLYTAVISNNAAAALLFPVAILAAASVHADPRPFAIAVIIASAASFATPISYQTNLMVYGPGGYRFADFIKIGLPLQVLVGIVAIALIYQIYF